jgi:hypothetical protein
LYCKPAKVLDGSPSTKALGYAPPKYHTLTRYKQISKPQF